MQIFLNTPQAWEVFEDCILLMKEIDSYVNIRKAISRCTVYYDGVKA